ncbi:5' nucleotidase, NT5C type [Desulfosporosinus youngiae]|uniref:Nucleotidase n=1 Tax=Desulfosporosinus youngiae DSM 17734 TaxID=768710 RepID=H5XRY2_9FIRM|nr:hypothetical protein [Desulfosporosinus youngiae]EHQ87519.1 hypothetical protein DesyoDRAFT_0324 [Desulfosporosinus youngiae DSM 17734]
MRIGVDIDGVISDSYPLWLQELNRHYGKNIPDIVDYNMHVAFGVTSDDMNEFFETNVERLLMMPEPIPGAKEGIETLLQDGHEIIYVTARTPEQKDLTVRWFSLREIHHEHVLCTGFGSKADVVKEWGIEAFIEDYQVNAKLIAECGVPVFLLNASYNQEELPPGIIRCHSWDEIITGIQAICHNKP